jgi:hypothetical protein
MAIHIHYRIGPIPFLAGVASGLVLLASLGCLAGGTHDSGDHAGQPNGLFLIAPATTTLTAGQSQQFSASTPWGGGATWTVLPATGGSIDANGVFTASTTPGSYSIIALWNNDVRYTATATATVLPPPPPPFINLGLVQAYGERQAAVTGVIHNDNVIGEPVAPLSVVGVTGSYQIRHGFHLPPAQ